MIEIIKRDLKKVSSYCAVQNQLIKYGQIVWHCLQ